MTDRQSQNVANVAAWSIKIGGSNLAQDKMNALISAEVETSLELPDQAILRFHDPKAELVNDSTFEPGKELEISMLNGSNSPVSPPLFKGEIVSLEPAFQDDYTATLTVRAYDKRHRMNRETKTERFAQQTDSDIIKTLAGNHGLQVTVDSTSQVRKMVFQQAQTDLEFLSLLAARNGFDVYVENGQLYCKTPATNPELTYEWGLNLLSFHPRLSLAGQVDQVLVRGWDTAQKREVVGTASSSRSAPQVGYGKSGGDAAKSAYSAAKMIEVNHVVATQDEATKLAQSMLDDINSEFLEADGVVVIPDAKLRAGKVVEIKKVGQRFSGKYRISSAQHVLEGGDHKVYFHIGGSRPKRVSDLVAAAAGQTSVASASAPSSFPAAAVGIVTNNEDPENLGRVKLKFPWFWNDGETEWARISTIGAGNDRGFFVLPEVNDEVLVVFLHGDMDNPIVLGGLYNGRDKPPLTSSQAVAGGKVVERMFKTTAGHVIQLTDKSGNEAININTHNSKVSHKMDAANGKMVSEANGDISIESKTSKVTVKASGDIVIESSTGKVNVTGTGGVTIKGSGPVSVESSASLTLKGSVVQIN